MSLTLTALKWMIALAIIMLVVRVFASFLNEATGHDVAMATFNLLILWAFFVALRKPIRWVAYLALPLCVLDFFGAISQGLSLSNGLNLLDAVFSFVAACGLVIWMSEERKAQSQ